MQSDRQNKVLKKKLVQATTGAMFIKLINMAAMIFISIILARILGPDELGYYALSMSVIQILCIPVSCGVPTIVTKESARLNEEKNWRLFNGLITFFKNSVMSLSLLIVGISGLIIIFFNDYNFDSKKTILLALIIIPVYSQIQLKSAILRGLGKITIAQKPDFIVKPLIFLLLLIVSFVFLDIKLNAVKAVGFFVGSTVIVAVYSEWLLRKEIPFEIKNENHMTFARKSWIKSWLMLALARGMRVLNEQFPFLIIAGYLSSEDVGYFKVATSISRPINVALLSVNMAIGPTISCLFVNGNFQMMQKVVTKSARAMFVFAFPISLAIIMFAPFFVPLLFGENYESVVIPLSILCIGQMVNTAMGSVVLILNMTGLEKYTVAGNFLSFIVTISFCFLSVNHWALNGIAFACALSLIVQNIFLALVIFKAIKIVTPCFLPSTYS